MFDSRGNLQQGHDPPLTQSGRNGLIVVDEGQGDRIDHASGTMSYSIALADLT